MIAYFLIILSFIFLALYLKSKQALPPPQPKIEEKRQERVSYGSLRIFYGTQTGTAAKLSEQLAEEGAEHGFACEVVDLKDV